MPAEIQRALIKSLYGTLPIFAGGVCNTIAVALLVALRHPSPIFLLWLAAEILISLVRLTTLMKDWKAAAEGRRTSTDLYMWLGVTWAGIIGYGTFITILNGDWVAIALVCLSTAAMAGGICFRNYGAPRLVAVMIVLSMGPCAIAMVMTGEPVLLITAFQIPFYLISMTIAALHLNGMLVATMCAERDNDYRARHDTLTGLLNRSGLEQCSVDNMGGHRALFYLDLNGFKAINDSHGHAAGDQLLKQVAGRLRATVGHDVDIARIGGDEFIILLPDADAPTAYRLGNRLLAAIQEQTFIVNGTHVTISASVGIAIDIIPNTDLYALMSKADVELYAAKAAGSGCSISRSSLPGLRLVHAELAATPRDRRLSQPSISEPDDAGTEKPTPQTRSGLVHKSTLDEVLCPPAFQSALGGNATADQNSQRQNTPEQPGTDCADYRTLDAAIAIAPVNTAADDRAENLTNHELSPGYRAL